MEATSAIDCEGVERVASQGMEMAFPWVHFPFTTRLNERPHFKRYCGAPCEKHGDTFLHKFGDTMPELINGKNIRTHSGRRHAISELAAAGIHQQVGMTWTQIDSARVYQGYIDLDPAQVYSAIVKYDKRKKSRK